MDLNQFHWSLVLTNKYLKFILELRGCAQEIVESQNQKCFSSKLLLWTILMQKWFCNDHISFIYIISSIKWLMIQMELKESHILDIKRTQRAESCLRARTKCERILLLLTILLSAAFITSIVSLIIGHLKYNECNIS